VLRPTKRLGRKEPNDDCGIGSGSSKGELKAFKRFRIYTGAWRAYYKALVESGTYLAGDPLEVPETGTTVRVKKGKRRVQDGPFADTEEQLGDSYFGNSLRSTWHSIWERAAQQAAVDCHSFVDLCVISKWP
jgi:hypothetical protein